MRVTMVMIMYGPQNDTQIREAFQIFLGLRHGHMEHEGMDHVEGVHPSARGHIRCCRASVVLLPVSVPI